MNKKDRASSDEKLLKIIEGASGTKQTQKVGIREKVKDKKLFSFIPKLKFSFSLSILNKAIFVICGLLTLFFIYTVINGTRIIDKNTGLTQVEGVSYFARLITEDQTKFLSHKEYLKEINANNVFLPSELRPGATGEGYTPKASKLMKDVVLVGIVWSKNPEVMIESTSEGRTFLLKKGEIFSQYYKVKDITRSSVILEVNLNGEATEFELR